jgi:hypothetical protein
VASQPARPDADPPRPAARTSAGYGPRPRRLSSGAKCNPGVTEGARYSFSPSRLCPLETEQKAVVRNGKPDFSLRNQCGRRGCTSRRNPPRQSPWPRRAGTARTSSPHEPPRCAAARGRRRRSARTDWRSRFSAGCRNPRAAWRRRRETSQAACGPDRWRAGCCLPPPFSAGHQDSIREPRHIRAANCSGLHAAP